MQTQINNAFADLNATMLERQTEWAVKTLHNFREKSPALYANRSIDAWTKYNELYSLCGGKGWFKVFSRNSEDRVRELVKKNVDTMIKNRDAKIIKALAKVGVTSIPEFTLEHNSDGYEGAFVVAGHTVNIRTILAGGYNVQCLHNRTLIKVK